MNVFCFQLDGSMCKIFSAGEKAQTGGLDASGARWIEASMEAHEAECEQIIFVMVKIFCFS